MSLPILRNVTKTARGKRAVLLQTEGIFAVDKPLEWTSGDVVRNFRGILERNARLRGAKTADIGSRRLNRVINIGHGGSLDRLATGVLVLGVGKGTKNLATYLNGPKVYIAEGEFGFETSTLDMEGKVTRKGFFNHITAELIAEVIPEFTGTILQVPPIYDAIQNDGKRLYKGAHRGPSEEDEVKIDPQEVEVLSIDLMEVSIPRFRIRVECRDGIYIRALIRDMGRRLDSACTTYSLVRTKHGPFTQEHCLAKDDWNAENIYKAIKNTQPILKLENMGDAYLATTNLAGRPHALTFARFTLIDELTLLRSPGDSSRFSQRPLGLVAHVVGTRTPHFTIPEGQVQCSEGSAVLIQSSDGDIPIQGKDSMVWWQSIMVFDGNQKKETLISGTGSIWMVD